MKRILKFILPYNFIKFFKSFRELKRDKNINLDKYYLLPRAQITYAQDLLYTHHNADFMKDPFFLESYNLGKATCSNLIKNSDIHWRIHVLCWAAFHAKHLEGDFVDCGVHTGIFARAVINYINFPETNKKYYLLDTFTGMEKRFSSEREMERNVILGYGKKTDVYKQVKETFKNFNVEIIKGAIPETLYLVKTEKVCFLSIDMNCVQPEVDALDFFWNKLVSGGVIILDDYGYANSTNDQKEAHDAFAQRKGVEILTLPTCQGLIIKP